jgi:cell wall-associated NlpC family hydrolase
MNKKHIAILGTAVVILASCTNSSSSVDGSYDATRITSPNSGDSSFMQTIVNHEESLTLSEKIAAEEAAIKKSKAEAQKIVDDNTSSLLNRIKESKTHIGKTPYVFSGSQPSGWDCSGFVRWFYSDLGFDLPHSATAQGRLQPKSKNAKIGDVVVFKYKSSDTFVHSAIYLGNNEIIHSGFAKGDKTEIISLNSPSFKDQDYFFVTLLKTNNEEEPQTKNEKLSDEFLVSILKEAGFSGNNLKMAWAISVEESTYDPNALNKSTDCYGIFQIRMHGGLGKDRLKKYGLDSKEDLFNPRINASVAYQMSNGGKNWSAWTTYDSALKNVKNFPG